ncbi:DNA polymerase III subunit gamma/tau [Blattabacterium sp. (Blattella germanica) str. Bge]|uniref:AAA family ATPase n=1 Tax=Blattabacterium sp. (Blattella germanica) TaxID=624186 RepID=UPI0001BB6284|nr:AAA family ATPase [Blattabacterium sp. (Blattella germanica)]ACY40590.1 DNA polymerase III subunit gamma/tau [Blattabacterium sp. (Blattella germanica) str. Bge]
MNKVFSDKIVLADKYKPLKWDELIGQENISITLKKAIQENRLSQVLFFFGPKGVGKNTCAHILANELNSFSEFKDISLNTFEINGFFHNSLKCIHRIIDTSRYSPKRGKYNIFIIKEIHKFSKDVFDFFLKFIEEKHPHILFIFCGTEEKIVPEFILSRCQVYEFQSLSVKKIFFHLKMIAEKENIEIENEALLLLSKHVEGSLSKAIHLFDRFISCDGQKISKYFIMNKLGIFDVKYYFEIVDYLLDENVNKILILLDKILQKKIDSYNLVVGFTKHFRNLFLSKNSETISILKFKKEIIQSYIEQSKKISFFFLIHALSIFLRLEKEYRLNNQNLRLTVEIHLIQLAHFFSIHKKNHKNSSIEKNSQEFHFYKENEKLHFLQKNWIKFVHNFSEKINPVYLDFLKNEIQFQIIRNKIFFMVPCKLDSRNFSLIQTNFEKYFKKKLNNPHLEFKVIKKKEYPIEQYNFLYQKNKLVETLIERLNLKISSSIIQEEKNLYN